MDMHSRNQYLKELQKRYFQAQSKKKRSSILMSIAKILIRIENMLSGKLTLLFLQSPRKGC